MGCLNLAATNHDIDYFYVAGKVQTSSVTKGSKLEKKLQTLFQNNPALKFAPSEEVSVTNSIHSLEKRNQALKFHDIVFASTGDLLLR